MKADDADMNETDDPMVVTNALLQQAADDILSSDDILNSIAEEILREDNTTNDADDYVQSFCIDALDDGGGVPNLEKYPFVDGVVATDQVSDRRHDGGGLVYPDANRREPCRKDSSNSEASTSSSSQTVVPTATPLSPSLSFASSSSSSSASLSPPPHQQLEDVDNSVRICLVCGNVAGKHNYYGGQACNSCRAFFRRAVQNMTYPSFVCKFARDCEINSKSWRSCQWCRFQKCLKSGMIIGWVLNENERKAREDKREEMRQKRKAQQRKEHGFDIPFYQQVEDVFTTEEEQLVMGSLEKLMNFRRRASCLFFASNLGHFEELLSALFRRTRLSREACIRGETFMTSCTIQFLRNASNVLSFLPDFDCVELVRVNHPCIVSMMSSIWTDSCTGNEQFGSIKKTILAFIDELSLREEMFAKFDKMSLNNTLKARPPDYDQVYPEELAQDRAAARRHRELTLLVRKWVMGDDFGKAGKDLRVRPHHIDPVQIFLTGVVILFSSDLVNLEDRQKVENIQTRYAVLLNKYLRKKFRNKNAGSEFCRAMQISGVCQELRHIREQQWQIKINVNDL